MLVALLVIRTLPTTLFLQISVKILIDLGCHCCAEHADPAGCAWSQKLVSCTCRRHCHSHRGQSSLARKALRSPSSTIPIQSLSKLARSCSRASWIWQWPHLLSWGILSFSRNELGWSSNTLTSRNVLMKMPKVYSSAVGTGNRGPGNPSLARRALSLQLQLCQP